MAPAVPHPYAPAVRHRNSQTDAQRQAAAVARAQKLREEDDAVLEEWKVVQAEVDKLSDRFGKKPRHFMERLHFQSRGGGKKMKINAYNAYLHAQANKENEGVYA